MISLQKRAINILNNSWAPELKHDRISYKLFEWLDFK